jgi:PAS domain S-box-containing protein
VTEGPLDPDPEPLSFDEAEEILRRMAGQAANPTESLTSRPNAIPTTNGLTLPGQDRSVAATLNADALLSLIEAVPDALVVADPGGRIVMVNAQTEQLFGYRRDELVGYPIELLVPERLRDRHVGQRDSFFSAPHMRPMGEGRDLSGRRKDGLEVPVEISLSPLHTSGGSLVVASIRDVTERRNAESQLRKMEKRYRTLVEGIPAVTFMAAMEEGTNAANELYVSPQIEELLGFSQREWLDNPVLWYTQLHPEDQNRWHEEFARTVSTGEPFRSVYRFIARDGRVVWVQGEAQLVRDEAGRPLFLQGVAFDITGIKQAEEELKSLNATLAERVTERSAVAEAKAAEAARIADALRVSEERYRMMVDGVKDYAILLLDPEGKVTSWNPAAERIKGYRAEEIIGRHFSVFYPSEDDPAVKTARELGTARAEGRYEEEGWRLRKDGSRFWANVLITALRDPDGCLQGFAKVTRDLTERKRAEEVVQAAQKELERHAQELARSNDALGQFGYVVAHDLRQPLRTMKSYIQKLAERYAGRLEEQADDYIIRAVNAADRMRILIDDLLAYSRVRTQGKEPVPVPCEEALTSALANLEVAIEESGASINAGKLPTVRADSTQLAQLFQNLIANALKFHSEKSPAIRITARRQGDEWLIEVIDNGIGIEPEYLKRIFGLGERLHGASKYPGHGIGLATCEKIVQRHGGRIWATSDGPGHGATISFTMPAAT